VSIVILLVLVAVLWIVVLAPSALRRFSEREGAGSIDHFHHQLKLLEHAGPKLVTPAYRLHTLRTGVGGSTSPCSIDAMSSRPKLVLLRAVDDGRSSDIDGLDGAHYERVGVIESPEPPISPAQTKAGLAAYRRQQARQRCTFVLRLLTVAAITSGLLGMLPSLRPAWFFTVLTGIGALALVGLIAYAGEVEGQRRSRRAPHVMYGDRHGSFDGAAGAVGAAGAARAGHPGAWDYEDDAHMGRVATGR
jgi:hypothetical protein